ncbi:MAG: glucose 1-dehydrogenase [Burkholderiaceae bacterium]
MTASPALTPHLLAGRTALVTGAARGNGRAIAIGLAAAGARVVVTDVLEAEAEETAATIVSAGGEASAFVLDVTDAGACHALAAEVATEIAPIDLLVNNAGILVRQPLLSENAAEVWRRIIDVNVNGSFNVTNACVASLTATRGTIVNIASIASFVGQAGAAGYAPSKGAIKAMTQSFAAELAPHGVRVNALAPGVIETPMTEFTRADPARLARFMTRIPLARLGKPEDLVGPVVFLSSALSAYVTGVTLPVDGGYLAV